MEKLGLKRRPRKESLAMLRPLHAKLKPEMWKQISLLDWI